MIKVCGIRSTKEALELKDLDIDFFGLIFANSKRGLDLQTAKQIASIFKQNGKKIVGVFTHKKDLKEVKKHIDFDVFQLHGDFEPRFCEELLKEKKELWRLFSVGEQMPDMSMFEQLLRSDKFYPLFDTLGKNLGGNGTAFRHEILAQMPPKSFIIAGGLSAKNCLVAKSYNPYVLDFNSKLETNDKKDKKKVEEIIQLLRSEK